MHGSALMITHLKLLDQNGKYIKFLSASDAFGLLDGKIIDVHGMLPATKKKRDKKGGIEKLREERQQRAKLYPQREFPTC